MLLSCQLLQTLSSYLDDLQQASTQFDNDTHFRALRAKCNAFNTPYEERLKTSNCLAVHEYNLNRMLVEVQKNMHCIGPKINWNSFHLMPKTYNLRRGDKIRLPIAQNTVCTNSFEFRAGMAWNNLPEIVKQAKSLNTFQTLLNSVKIYCTCKSCSKL